MKPQLLILDYGGACFAGKVLGRSGGQTNRLELARRDGHHTTRRRTAATAGLNDRSGGHHKNGNSQILPPRLTYGD